MRSCTVYENAALAPSGMCCVSRNIMEGAILRAFWGAILGAERTPNRCASRCGWGAVGMVGSTLRLPMPTARFSLALAFSGVRSVHSDNPSHNPPASPL
jgi:hypothetical protein